MNFLTKIEFSFLVTNFIKTYVKWIMRITISVILEEVKLNYMLAAFHFNCLPFPVPNSIINDFFVIFNILLSFAFILSNRPSVYWNLHPLWYPSQRDLFSKSALWDLDALKQISIRKIPPYLISISFTI